eukprot:4657023-Pyramimonas_sp.AAC.1
MGDGDARSVDHICIVRACLRRWQDSPTTTATMFGHAHCSSVVVVVVVVATTSGAALEVATAGAACNVAMRSARRVLCGAS